jgi:hypothetical protein
MTIWSIYGHLVYFTVIWSFLRSFGIGILWPFGAVYDHLEYILVCFGVLYQEKSGNPVSHARFKDNT